MGAPSPSVSIAELADVSVLIVDDNTTNRRVLADFARRWGLQPLAVADGETALRVLQEQKESPNPFRLAILDAQMPGMDGFQLAERIKHDGGFDRVAIMMLTSNNRQGDALRCRELGIALYLRRPLRKSELLSAILTALGKVPDRRDQPQPAVVVPSAAVRQRRRILVAEDNPVNQKVMTRVLEKLGHEVLLASNGREALFRVSEQTFDVVLMDVQMPELDGLSAIAEIREKEKDTGLHLPIIAVTAHAMKADQDRCFAAGADTYLSKPVSSQQVQDALQKVLGPECAQTAAHSAGN